MCASKLFHFLLFFQIRDYPRLFQFLEYRFLRSSSNFKSLVRLFVLNGAQTISVASTPDFLSLEREK